MRINKQFLAKLGISFALVGALFGLVGLVPEIAPGLIAYEDESERESIKRATDASISLSAYCLTISGILVGISAIPDFHKPQKAENKKVALIISYSSTGKEVERRMEFAADYCTDEALKLISQISMNHEYDLLVNQLSSSTLDQSKQLELPFNELSIPKLEESSQLNLPFVLMNVQEEKNGELL